MINWIQTEYFKFPNNGQGAVLEGTVGWIQELPFLSQGLTITSHSHNLLNWSEELRCTEAAIASMTNSQTMEMHFHRS